MCGPRSEEPHAPMSRRATGRTRPNLLPSWLRKGCRLPSPACPKVPIVSPWRPARPATAAAPVTYQHAEVDPLGVGEARALLEQVDGHRLGSLFTVPPSLGLRQGAWD
jgi:hypothetical protein